MFDKSSDGYVRSEGAGVVIIKRLDKAIENNDQIDAVICGSAVNNDGATNGIVAPSYRAQTEVIKKAYDNAKLRLGQADYVECHGTGTALGDLIELRALKSVFKDHQGVCYLGSVKSNLGHLESASGIASLIKCVLMLKREKIFANLHLNDPIKSLLSTNIQFRVPTTTTNWPNDKLIIASISNFSIGGTNAHVVLSKIDTHYHTNKCNHKPRAGKIMDRKRCWFFDEPNSKITCENTMTSKDKASEDTNFLVKKTLFRNINKITKSELSLSTKEDLMLTELGIESLQVIEIKTAIEEELNIEIPLAYLLQSPKISIIIEKISSLLINGEK